MTAYNLGEDVECVCCGMKLDTLPACNASSSLIDPDEKTWATHCGNKMRMRFSWDTWHTSAPFNETATEWAQVSHRECLNKQNSVAHPSNCQGDTITSKTEIIRTYDLELTWNEASDFCGERNGLLFGAVDGTRDQIDLLVSKLVAFLPTVSRFWIGVTDEEREGSWRDMQRAFVARSLLWHETQPDGGVESNAVLMERAGDGLFYANDVVQDSVQAPFFCNIILDQSDSY